MGAGSSVGVEHLQGTCWARDAGSRRRRRARTSPLCRLRRGRRGRLGGGLPVRHRRGVVRVRCTRAARADARAQLRASTAEVDPALHLSILPRASARAPATMATTKVRTAALDSARAAARARRGRARLCSTGDADAQRSRVALARHVCASAHPRHARRARVRNDATAPATRRILRLGPPVAVRFAPQAYVSSLGRCPRARRRPPMTRCSTTRRRSRRSRTRLRARTARARTRRSACARRRVRGAFAQRVHVDTSSPARSRRRRPLSSSQGALRRRPQLGLPGLHAQAGAPARGRRLRV